MGGFIVTFPYMNVLKDCKKLLFIIHIEWLAKFQCKTAHFMASKQKKKKKGARSHSPLLGYALNSLNWEYPTRPQLHLLTCSLCVGVFVYLCMCMYVWERERCGTLDGIGEG
jgi:hypothetical protein